MLQIKTNQLKSRKKVLIDDTEYTVRRMGNIEQMDYNQCLRVLEELIKKEEAGQKLTKDEEAEVDRVSKDLSMILVGLFDDGGDQTKSRKLLGSLTDTEINIMFEQIFEEDSERKLETAES